VDRTLFVSERLPTSFILYQHDIAGNGSFSVKTYGYLSAAWSPTWKYQPLGLPSGHALRHESGCICGPGRRSFPRRRFPRVMPVLSG